MHNLPESHPPRARSYLTAAIAAILSAGTTAADAVTIPEIQGTGHYSPLTGMVVETSGIVTAVDFDGFYLQDALGDGDPNTSDALFVFTSFARPAVSVGDEISLEGTVTEFIPGGADTGNLSITELTAQNNSISVLSSGNSLPQPVRLGQGGLAIPNETVISDEEIASPINLQDPADAAANPFNPDVDGIDFYEALEGMRVTVSEPVAVSAVRTFSPFSSEFFALADNGDDIAPPEARTARGGINLPAHPDNQGDQNPERVQIQIDSDLFPDTVPLVSVGDKLTDVTGVLGYSFGNFEVNATDSFFITPNTNLPQETTDLLPNARVVTIASYNVLNLSAGSEDDAQRTAIAGHIAQNLGSPDVVALQEIQDNDGEDDTGETDANLTLQALVDAIADAGGPTYQFFDVAPEDGVSGGVPGGNIRNAFLYNPQRVALDSFVSLTPTALADAGVGNAEAFAGTRDPLVATFTFLADAANDENLQFTVINNHLTSRFGSTPVFGAVQPFTQAGESEREAQMQALNDYTDALLANDAGAQILLTGDLNTFEFTNDLTEILPGDEPVYFNLIEKLRDDNVYTFNFEGNSQVLDQALVSRALRHRARTDIVHVNVDYPRIDDTIASDHEPLVTALRLVKRPQRPE